jgi:hypothetical protein
LTDPELARLTRAYARLSEPSARLLRWASLLEEGEGLDAEAAALILDGDPAAGAQALAGLHGFPDTTSLSGGGVALGSRARAFSSWQLTSSDSGGLLMAGSDVQSRLRRWRMQRRGVPPRSRLTRDYWTTEDSLAYRPYAEAVAAFIRHRDTRPPLTIGIRGPWGAGKTSLMRMVRQELDPPGTDGAPRPIALTGTSRNALHRPSRWWPARRDRARPVTNAEVLREAGSPDTAEPPGMLAAEPELAGAPLRPAEWRASVWFNPWTYQNNEQVWAGLAHSIITQVTDRLEPGDRERFWLRLNLARLDRLAVRRRAYRLFVQRLVPLALVLLGALLVAAALWVTGLARDAAGWLATGGASAFATLGVLRYLAFRTESAASGFGRLLAAPVAARVANGVPDGLVDELFPDPGYTARAGFLHLGAGGRGVGAGAGRGPAAAAGRVRGRSRPLLAEGGEPGDRGAEPVPGR